MSNTLRAAAIVVLALTARLSAQSFDFETGIAGWTPSGAAFDGQPYCAGRMTSTRFAPVSLGGTYWKELTYPLGQNGRCLLSSAGSGQRGDDALEGSLTSPEFTLGRAVPYLSFRVSGAADLGSERVELQVRAPATLEPRIREWMAALPGVPGHDGDYVVAAAFTGHGSDAFRQEIVAVPDFLWGLSARIRVIDGSPRGHINLDYVRLTAAPPAPLQTAVWGYADYHTHPMTYMAFGGLKGIHVLWGNPGGNFDDYSDTAALTRDIPHCPPRHGGGYVAEQFINQAQTLPSRLGFNLGALLFPHKTSGGPEFANFPSHLMGAHEQMHITMIHRNYLGGLRLMVALATDNMAAEYLTGYVKNGKVDLIGEKQSVEAQLSGVQRLADLNKSWMEIAYSAQQARDIIGRNHLAVVLGVEVDQLGTFGYDTPQQEVGYLWGKGVRAVIPIHAADNRLGGPAIFEEPYNWLTDFLNRKKLDDTVHDLDTTDKEPHFFKVRDEVCEGKPGEIGDCVMYRLSELEFRVAITRPIFAMFRRAPWIHPVSEEAFEQKPGPQTGHKNQQGLKDCGRSYIDALMRKGMIVDTAHMSDASVSDTFDVIGKRLGAQRPECGEFSFAKDVAPTCYDDAYPTIISHAHFREQAIYDPAEAIPDYLPSEYDISRRNLEMVRRVGGVVGPFVTEARIHESNISGIDNDCGMSSKDFAFSFHYALQKMAGIGVGMATDFTLIPTVAPRFGEQACEGYHTFHNGGKERRQHPERYLAKKQEHRVEYQGADALEPYRMNQRTFDFNLDGMAHYGLVPDMLQDLKVLGVPPDDMQSLFSSAEAYLKTWEKSERLSLLPGAPATWSCTLPHQ
jgi:microsomal dipeptidase-like Zn-dependent dipeptidase